VEEISESTMDSRLQCTSYSIDFASDDLDAIILLLRITHLQFKSIPNKLFYRQLLQIAILWDQYSCASLVAPWLQSWLSSEKSELKEGRKEGWIFISWVFGRESIFEEVVKKLVFEVKIGDKGECLTKSGAAMPEPMPNEILGMCLLLSILLPMYREGQAKKRKMGKLIHGYREYA
jgi:hypothetical protein